MGTKKLPLLLVVSYMHVSLPHEKVKNEYQQIRALNEYFDPNGRQAADWRDKLDT